MTSFASVLKEEVRRLARKEIRQQTGSTAQAVARYRREIAQLKRQIHDLHKKLGFLETPHTRGFHARVDDLYHLALATPPENRRPLVWIRMGKAWRIDWSKLRSSRPSG